MEDVDKGSRPLDDDEHLIHSEALDSAVLGNEPHHRNYGASSVSNAFGATDIRLIGSGTSGLSIVDNMISHRVRGIKFIRVVDQPVISPFRGAHRIIQLCTPLSIEDLRAALVGSHLLFITFVPGEETGTVSAQTIARVAREMGILVIGFAIQSSSFYALPNLGRALGDLSAFEAVTDSLIVVPEEFRLAAVSQDEIDLGEGNFNCYEILSEVISGIADIIHLPGLICMDFEDVRMVLSCSTRARIGIGRAIGIDRARRSAQEAASCPLLGEAMLSTAKGALVIISAAKRSLKLSEIKDVVLTVRSLLGTETHVTFGTRYGRHRDDVLSVTLVLLC